MNRSVVSSRWAELSPLLDQLLDLAEPERADALKKIADTELRGALAELLAAHPSQGVLDCTPEQVASLIAQTPITLSEEDRIGRYRLLRLIGEGGSGSVYLAERSHEGYSQRVALKLLRVGVRDPIEKARFQREQRILARLEHPNISRLLDAGIGSWAKEIAPSTELRKSFAHQPERFGAFREAYRSELDGNPKALAFAAFCKDALAVRNVTLLYAAKDEVFNNAAVLREWLLEQMKRSHSNGQ
jgi:uncharacterized protein YeaO (DUF488 family)